MKTLDATELNAEVLDAIDNGDEYILRELLIEGADPNYCKATLH
jgi:hypothetical protein